MTNTTEFKQAIFDFLEEDARITLNIVDNDNGTAMVTAGLEIRNPVNNKFEEITTESDFLSIN